MVPWPAITWGWSNGGISERPRSAASLAAAASRSGSGTWTTSGAEGAGSVDLDRGGGVLDDDHRGDSEGAGGVGDGLGMVAARVGDHAARPVGVGEPADRVVGAAKLERADRLEALRLEPQWTVGIRP
jgi:hypothetical protein